jgi:hypothetical protein
LTGIGKLTKEWYAEYTEELQDLTSGKPQPGRCSLQFMVQSGVHGALNVYEKVGV